MCSACCKFVKFKLCEDEFEPQKAIQEPYYNHYLLKTQFQESCGIELPAVNKTHNRFIGWNNQDWLQWINHFGEVNKNAGAATIRICICSCI